MTNDRSLRFCAQPGCRKLVRKGYCEKHTRFKKNERSSSLSKSDYDFTWQKVRKEKLLIDPLCEKCGGYKRLVVHHIKPINEGGERLDLDNLQTLCRDCHERIHGRIKYER